MRYIFLALFIYNASLAQITTKREAKSFTVTYIDTSTKIQSTLSFYRNYDTAMFTTMRYTSFNYVAKNKTEQNLCPQIPVIIKMWHIAKDSIKMDLNSMSVDYPKRYDDIFKKHIEVFIQSAKWQNHVKAKGKKDNIKLMHEIMMQDGVYFCLNDFLNSIGYMPVGISTEKRGFVTKDELKKLGYKGNEIIPMPFMVWITITNK